MRRVPVTGELTGQRRGPPSHHSGCSGEQLGEPRVEPNPLAREQVVVHGLAHQRVPEAVRTGVVLDDEHVVLRRVAQAVG